MVSVFMSYSHVDEALRDQLEKHLSTLKRDGVIDIWHDRRIVAGEELDHAIGDALESAQVVLLLVSSDFLASDYCHDREMMRAMERQQTGDTCVLPVILRHCDWKSAPFGKLRATPTDGKPVVKWPDIDEAFLSVVDDIRRAVEAMDGAAVAGTEAASPRVAIAPAVDPVQAQRPRSSNLGVRRTFTQADKDRFLSEGFEYIANFFEESLHELAERHGEIEIYFQRVDARTFTSVVYRNGDAVSRCRIFIGGLGRTPSSIMYSNNDSAVGTAFNESMSVDEGEQTLGFKPTLAWHGSDDRPHLTHQGAAEHYWSELIEPLQR